MRSQVGYLQQKKKGGDRGGMAETVGTSEHRKCLGGGQGAFCFATQTEAPLQTDCLWGCVWTGVCGKEWVMASLQTERLLLGVLCIRFTREISPRVQTRLKVAGAFGGTGGGNCGVKWKQQNRGTELQPSIWHYRTRLHVDCRIVLERLLFFTLLWIQQNLKTDSLKEFFWFLWEWLMRWNPAHRQESWVINNKTS